MTNYRVPTTVTRIMGVDASTKTGVVVLENRLGTTVPVYAGKVCNPKLKGWDRLAWVEDQFNSLISAYQPEFAVIEGYGFRNKFTLVTLVEVGTTIRRTLLANGVIVGTLTPKSLKQFVTGNGNADKKLMKKAAEERWGFKTTDNDQADAYGLAQAGVGYFAINCISARERGILNLLSLLNSASITPLPFTKEG